MGTPLSNPPVCRELYIGREETGSQQQVSGNRVEKKKDKPDRGRDTYLRGERKRKKREKKTNHEVFEATCRILCKADVVPVHRTVSPTETMMLEGENCVSWTLTSNTAAWAANPKSNKANYSNEGEAKIVEEKKEASVSKTNKKEKA